MSRLKRLIAVLLLALASVNASAGVCAIACASLEAAPASIPCPDHEPTPMPAACDLAHLCALAVTPAIFPAGPRVGNACAAFVPPLAPTASAGIDADPPLKPPAV